MPSCAKVAAGDPAWREPESAVMNRWNTRNEVTWYETARREAAA